MKKFKKLELSDFATKAMASELTSNLYGGDGYETEFSKLEYSNGLLTPLDCNTYGDWWATC